MFCHKSTDTSKIRYDGFVPCLFNPFIHCKDHGRKNCNTTDNTKYNTFCHNNTKIHTKCKCHETQCDKSGYCCNRTSDYRFEGCIDGMCHSPLFITLKPLLILLITVQQENGIIHGNTKLQDCCQCLSDV